MTVTFKDIEEANKQILKTDIKGKGYAQVNSRIMAFRKLFPEGLIKTEIVSNEPDEKGIHTAVMRAYAYETDGGKLLGTGTAYEKENSTFINKTSYLENVETSAVGRCLGMLGLGVDEAFASAEEVQTAQANQQEKPKQEKQKKVSTASEPQITLIKKLYNPEEIEGMVHRLGKEHLEEITKENASKMIQARSLQKEARA